MEAKDFIEGIIISVIFFVALFVLIIFLIRYAWKKAVQAKIEQEELLRKHQEELLVHTVKTQENERDRFSTEIHDAITSKISAIALQFRAMVKEDNIANSKVGLIQNSLNTLAVDSRKIAYALYPIIIEKFGLAAGVEELVELNNAENLKIDFQHNLADEILPKHQAVDVYRILQELLQNTIKYAQADKIKILMQLEGNELTLVYEDNGIGQVSKLENSKGLGMKNISSRVSVLNGKSSFVDLPKGIGFNLCFTVL